ncbi:pseudouridine synthase [Rhodococcus opacus]|uniref:pseudouridine synthase n=1 Tax=Rhodococcus TaxID=1827 RepID=UPI0002A234A7|nr:MULTISPECIES: pseudouridine synthase [Rhodococcus]ELB93597.1 pseudouridylate synthase [Rhodococcus wratislaviensis IFP 2016]NHU48099.1 pseudouridine synthase [Rhodococcus sp. A14]MBA8964431.1 tRNA pseudouridine32 synthase/23S rRNA pseudouridine746 synthase [Rhodococcus opacus]MBP2207606.1 tRNA pseudouridine32 synthase/23S rRNA pseudouridine746 synthase [Rhodococcus opacus]MDI9939513.1 pseudouridine synthase [Rhodococcus sp. IEGM 1351]
MAGAPLPVRNGLGPDRIRMPAGVGAKTVAEFLVETYPDERAHWLSLIDGGEVVDEHGRVVDRGTRYAPTRFVYFYRDPAPEIPVPFEIDVLHRDDHLVVIDKPHFLATIPRGAHITETAVVRLRRALDLPDLTPAHRLDRMTAGVLVFLIRPEDRRPYQELFVSQQVTKEYEAVAGHDPTLAFPRTIRSRIVKEHGIMTATEEPGEPNSETVVELIETRDGRARYRLLPKTGRTHQLRLHMSSLGLPIEGDNYYPDFRRSEPGDFSTPLRLLARAIEFTDPRSGEVRRFESRRTLGW